MSILGIDMASFCMLKNQGFEFCGCVVYVGNRVEAPCRAGLMFSGNEIYRLVYDVMLSRPEDYLSIYQSGCNHNCLKCHSWYFAQYANGIWYSPRDIVEAVLRYREGVTVWEPKERATMWHASDLCAHCGLCVVAGIRGRWCPGKLKKEQVVLSPQGWGPARNIVSFTGGDLYCQPVFYIKTFKLLKKEVPDMWIHIETNGYGLTPKNLELLYEAGLDSIWLDLKAFREDIYRYLCGTTNKWILDLPALIHDMDIVLEIVILYIPTIVEVEEIELMGTLVAGVDRDIPVTLLAFFPEHMLSMLRSPTVEEMLKAYRVLKERCRLNKVKIGNIGVFTESEDDIDKLVAEVGREALAL
jgi:pyruvate-formate lyase-activating enzyme